jgi:hypothetical protein
VRGANVKERRDKYVSMLMDTVEQLGFIEFTHTFDLDDPPLDPMKEAYHLFAQSLAGRVPEDSLHETLESAVAKESKKRGYTFEVGPFDMGRIIAPIKKWRCPCCDGKGYKQAKMFLREEAADLMLTMDACFQCRGRGTIESRTAPAFCKMEDNPMWGMPMHWRQAG